MDINSCLFEGTLKDAPEMTYTQNGTARTKLTLVIEEGKRNQWIPIVLWAEVAEEAAEFLAANQRLRVQMLGSRVGHLTIRRQVKKSR